MDDQHKSIAVWDKVARVYQEKFMDLDLYDATYDLFCSYLAQPGARVFEIGCGPGNVTKYLLAKRPDLKIEAIDSSLNMIELARINNPTASFRVMDARDLHSHSGPYDGILCGFCLPYLSKEECEALIKQSAALLKAGGILYLSVIEGDYSRSGYETGSTGDSLYVYHHEAAYLQDYLHKNGFEPLNLERRPYQKSGGEQSVHAIFIARKK